LEGLEVNEKMYSELRESIFGSDFNSFRKQNALHKIKASSKVSDYFELHSNIVSNLSNVLSYDLTHTLGNFLHDIEISESIEGNRKLAQHGDFIISRLRSYLKEFAVVQSKNNKQVFSTEYLVYRPKTDKISSNTLLAFCLTNEVQTILNCSQYGTEHPRFYEFIFNELPLPDVLFNLNEKINALFDIAYKKREQSQTLYRQAEELLLETIGLKDFTPSQEKTNIKTFKESFLGTGRLDAEYYQPKYEEMIMHIETFETERLRKIVNIKKSIEPGSDAYETEGIPFIRVSNLSKFGLTDTDIYLDKAKFGNLDLQPKKDTILLSKDGSVGIAYKIEQDLDIITSGALLHLTVTNKDFLPDYVTLVLNSEVVKMQAERDAGGSIIQHWKPSEIEQVIIPKISMSIQQQISALIQESFALRKESERLLVEAKEMVEREIEKINN